ncbi:MAG: WYL domain-containing protein, partial [Bacteroidaceae bacterium]|nr:WYL domain-containing protein [Bacteroidaceae bacterium]
MKPALIFHQYIWLINTLRRYRSLTLGQLNRKWMDDEVAEGNPLSRTTFNRHRDAILDMFGVIIDCDNCNGYRYYISNPEVLNEDTIERWMLSTLTVEGVLSDSASIKDRILLENVPAGEEYLSIIIKAIKT